VSGAHASKTALRLRSGQAPRVATQGSDGTQEWWRMTIARQVETWYQARQEHLSRLFLKTQIGLSGPDHPGGEIGVGLEGETVVANICVFNSGLITIPAVNKASGQEFVLEHHVLAPDEDLALLLDRYVERIATPS
jgi:hypothetical protein